ncbi:MAG: phasin family protein [Blastochloris viridis]|uniref:Phasin family protein n=1 Tax=Blastochloris viridis TaxID=1079 RepID=A0A6N4RDK8_BLAVI|nr:MAG: phasin family protein [Blastochloris viridis]
MFTNDFSKMFDPSQYTQTMQQNMQKFFDWSSAASTSKQNLEAMKQVSSIVTDTIANCTEKQFKYAQSTMEDCVEALRELSTAKGIEDYMSKQTEISKRSAEKAQSIAQEISTQWQKTQAKCSDIISQQTSQTLETFKSTATTAATAAKSAAGTTSGK